MSTPAAATKTIAEATPSAAEAAAKASGASSTAGTPAKAKPGDSAGLTPPQRRSRPRKPGAPARAGARPTSVSAKRIVLFSVIAAGSAVALRDFKRGTVPSIRVGVGVLFAGIFLSALADVVPEVAGPLGLLVLVGAFLLPGANGEPSVGADLIASVRSIAKK